MKVSKACFLYLWKAFDILNWHKQNSQQMSDLNVFINWNIFLTLFGGISIINKSEYTKAYNSFGSWNKRQVFSKLTTLFKTKVWRNSLSLKVLVESYISLSNEVQHWNHTSHYKSWCRLSPDSGWFDCDYAPHISAIYDFYWS
jgi:hypothetical protein